MAKTSDTASGELVVNKPDAPIVVAVSEYRGVQRLDIRQYWTTPDGVLAPTQKGVSIPLEKAEDLFNLIGSILEAVGILEVPDKEEEDPDTTR